MKTLEAIKLIQKNIFFNIKKLTNDNCKPEFTLYESALQFNKQVI